MSATSEQYDFSSFIRRDAHGHATIELAVDGVACAACIGRIEGALKHVAGVEDARLNFTTKRLTVGWSGRNFTPATAIATVEGLGYRARPFHTARAEEHDAARSRFLLRCLGVAGFAAMNIMLLSVSVWSGNATDITPETRDLFHWISALIALPAAAYSGRPFFQSAWSALRKGNVNMDVPISLGIFLALGMSLVETANHATHTYFDSAIMLIFFLLCGRYADDIMRRKTRAAAGNLAALRAQSAHRITEANEIVTVPVSALRPGDRVLVRPGERVPADGIVVSGISEVDESLVTGESAPRWTDMQSDIYAGSLNIGAAITVMVEKAHSDSLIADIDSLLHKAVTTRSRYVRLADRAAGYYAPIVHTAAALTLIGWLLAGASLHDSILTAISVLIITCPCALALAVPAVQVVAASRLFRAGIFLNAGDAIERFAEIDTIVFDKTGTLTLPEPTLLNAKDIQRDTLERAARLALSTQHPLASTLARHASNPVPFAGVVEEPGLGIRTTIDGAEARLGHSDFCNTAADADVVASTHPGASTLAFRHGDTSAVFAIGQSLRPDAVGIVRSLSSQGVHVKILSGDRPAAVAIVAKALDIQDWRGGLKPGEKVAALEALKAEGHRVLMVGDGINDAPSLAAAHVSLSPVSAAEISQAHADGVFVGASLNPVLHAVLISRKARRLMRENLYFSVAYNLFAMPLAVAGFVTPLIAAAAMSASSVLVTLNAMRLGIAFRAKRKAERLAAATGAEATAS